MDLAEHLAYRWFAMGNDFGAINVHKQLLVDLIVFHCDDPIPVMQKVIQYRE